MSGVHNWKERPINSKVSALAAGFLLAIAVTRSSWIFPIVVYTKEYNDRYSKGNQIHVQLVKNCYPTTTTYSDVQTKWCIGIQNQL